MSNTLPNFSLSLADDEFNLFEVPNPTGSPERRLLLAVLERAILDYVGNDSKEVAEAEEWIFSEIDDPSFTAYSFPWICQELDLDVATIAKSIEAMPKRGKNKIAPWYFNKRYFNKTASKAGISEQKETQIDSKSGRNKVGQSCKVMAGKFPRYH